jgi:feruloyl esterase
MVKLSKMVSDLLAQHGGWEKLMQTAGRGRPAAFGTGSTPSRLAESRNFGSNPGALRMFTHVPSHVPAGCALVVVLHGCAQSAESYDLGAGWSALADRFGFAVLLPEQQRANNPNACFNWFEPADTSRGSGEALSIRQMVDKMVSDHGVDPRRVFITGLSAGGAMTSAMLATYPEVFAGGAIIAGLPFGAASNMQQAFETMRQCPARPARTWGDLVRAASPHAGPWPRVSVWHGGADATVVPSNAQEIVKQWTDIHGLPATPSLQAVVDGYPRQVWVNEAGEEMIESYTIPHMMHGTPLATGNGHDECGAAGPFLLEVGISSSYHIVKFFGLTAHVESAASDAIVTSGPRAPGSNGSRVSSSVLEGEILDRQDPHAGPYDVPRSPFPVDVNAVIAKALRAAGLIKG